MNNCDPVNLLKKIKFVAMDVRTILIKKLTMLISHFLCIHRLLALCTLSLLVCDILNLSSNIRKEKGILIFFLCARRLLSGAGNIKIHKDGNVLLHGIQIEHLTVSLITRASTAQDDTTSTVLLIDQSLRIANVFFHDILDDLKIPTEVRVARGHTLSTGRI